MSKNCTMDELQASVKAKAEEAKHISTRTKTVPKKCKMENNRFSTSANSSRQRNNRTSASHSSHSSGLSRNEQNCGMYNFRGCTFTKCWDAHVYDPAAGLRLVGNQKHQGKGLIANSKYAYQLNDLTACRPP